MDDDFLDSINQEVIAHTGEDRLERVRAAASELRDLESQREDLEERLADVKNRIKMLVERDLVRLMSEANMTSFSLDREGNSPPMKFDRVTNYYAKIPEDKEIEAFNWLHDQGHGDIVKTEIKLTFGMKERDQAQELEKDLASKRYDYDSKLAVHPSTLKAFVKHEVEAGSPIPLDLFGAYIQDVVKLKKGK
jgi:hypothetical protein